MPEPTLFAGVLEPYPVPVPYSKYQVVDRPFGSTVPLSVAEETVTPVAEPVTATGADAVVKIPSPPRVVPPLLVATTR
jgi:hypothetical protein